MDINLIDKLTTGEEKSGIFNMLMKHLRRVLKNKEIFVSAKTIDERRAKYQLASDPINAFVDTAIKLVIDDDNEPKNTTKDVMYVAYSEFCTINKISAVKKEAFGRTLSKRFEWSDSSERYGDKICRVWVNRRLTPEYEEIAHKAVTKIHKEYGQETLDVDA
jgi:hypothetical protein